MALFVSACRCLPELSFSIAKDKDAFQIFFDIFTNSADPKSQEEVSYIANFLSNVPEFHHFLSTRCPLGDLLKTIVKDKTPDLAVVALCRTLPCVCKNDEDFRDKLCEDADLLKILVQLWYARRANAKFFVLELLQLLLSEEKASKLLTESASEGQILAFVEDLSRHRMLAEAYATGGANLFCPPIENDLIVMEKSRLVDQVDIEKLCSYLGTLARPEEETTLVELCAASGRMLNDRLLCAQIAQKMQGPSVYAVDWACGLVGHVSARAGGERVYSKLCDYETVDQLPALADLVLIAGVWQSLEDPPQLFQSIISKLKVGGKVVLMERQKECLEDAKHWARKSGFEIFAEPKHASGCIMCVLALHDQ